MRRDKLFGNKFMRLSACALMAFAYVGEALGQDFASSRLKTNPAFLSWFHDRAREETRQDSAHHKTGNVRLLSASSSGQQYLALGLVPDLYDMSYLANMNVGTVQSVGVEMPESYDLREQESVSSVKNQNPYGTCWAHATFGSMESWLKKSAGVEYDFSENNLVNLNGWDYSGWKGGNPSASSGYLLRWAGPVLESEDKYAAPYKSEEMDPGFHVQQIRWIPGKASSTDNDGIKKAILNYGGVFVTYYHDDSLLSSSNGYYYTGTSNDNHAVTIVGWNDKYSRSNFKTKPSGDGAYIVKNSWGHNWGENGYFYVSYYDSRFGRSLMYSFSNAEDADNYAKKYEYDPLGFVYPSFWESSTCRLYGANIFKATGDDEIAAVGFYALGPNTSYSISVYTDVKLGNPVDGTCMHTQSGTQEMAGYYTVPLGKTVSVQNGKLFSVVMSIKTPGCTNPLALEIAYRDGIVTGSDYPTSNADAAEGQSFISFDGSKWADMYKYATKYRPNFCCKAYTKSATAAKPTLLSIAVQPEDDKTMSLKPGDKVQMKCEATYSNNGTSNVTDAAQWSLTSGRNYATLSSSGLLTAKNVTVLEPQTITVQAIYTEDGIVATNRYGFSMAETPPEAPTDVTATQGTDASCIHVNWTAPAGATEYAVYRAVANNVKNVDYLENVNVAKYHDTGSAKPIVPGVDYWYFIKAKNAAGPSKAYSSSAMGWRKLSPPESESVIASDNLLDKVSLEWGEVEGATHYRVYRADEFDGEKTAISGWQTARTYNDVPKEKDRPYYYYVVAAVDASGNRPSDYSIVEDGMMVSPVTVDYLEIKGDASIASGGYADYTADVIYTDKHRVENVSPVTLTVSGDGATVSGNRVTAATVTENKKVVLLASYTENGKIAPGEKEITIAAVKPNTPTGVTARLASQGVTITWDAVSGAVSYKVYRAYSANAVATQIGMTAGTSYPDTSAMPGVAYTYSVSAVNGAGESERSGGVVVTVPLAAPTGVTATSDLTDGVNVKWSAVNGATHYRVARATSPTGAKTQLGSWQTGTAYLDTSATAETTYYYFVRAATSSSGANASEYSTPAAPGMRIPSRTLLSIAISGMDKVPASKSAVYTCVATYSDETTETVTPAWSVSPTSAATINENGLLMAKAAMSDTKVTVTASYGGKTDTMEVTIVAPAAASASVSNIRIKPRWPFSPLVDIDYTLTTSPDGTFALVSLSGQDNDHNLPLAARTLTGDGASGVVAAGERRITWDIGADYPNLHVKSLDVVLDAMPCVITAPANLTASAGTSSYAVELTWDAVTDATGYEIWRSVSPSTANASNIVTVAEGTTYSDTDANAMQPYFYWVKTVTEYGTSDFGDYVYGYRLPPVSGTVTLDPNGGTVSETSLSYIDGTAYGTLPRATRSGYDFVGWFTAKDGGTEVTADTIATDSIPTLYAHWTPCEYFVHFDPNGGMGTMDDLVMTYDVAKNLTSNMFTKTGYVFAGWATNTTGAVIYADGASITTTADMALYAKWSHAVPSDVNASDAVSTDFVSVIWSAVVDAIAYEIWRHDEDGNNVTNIASVVALGYEDTSATPGQSYYYSVRAVFQNSVGELSAEDVGCRKLQTPSLSASQGDDWNRVVLTTGELPIGTPLTVRVEIWRSESPSISSAEEIGTVSGGQRYYDSNVIAGNNYYYWTRLYYGANDVSKSDFSPCVVGYASEVSSVYISGTETLTPGGQACYRLMATCNDGAVRVFPGTVSYGFQDRYGIVNFRSEFMTPGDWSLESSSYLMWLTITNADITASRTITLTATSSYKDVTRTVSKSVTIKPKPNNFPYGYAVSSSGLVALTGYSGTDSIITVPSQINGMTVVELASTFRSDKVGIKSVSLPSSLQIIGGRAFYLCKSLTSISIPSSVTTISGSAFTGTALTSITIPSTVTSISEAAFDYACRLQSINVDSRNPKYSSSSGVLFNKDMTTLIAYPPAKSDKTYNIPDGVTYISSYSSGFHACFNLTSITLPNSLTGIYTGQVFQNCDALASIQVSEGNPSFCSSEGVLYSKNMDKLIKYPNAKKSTTFVVPPSVGIIDGCAFNCATNLCQLVIPASVTNCCGIAGCEALTAIYCFGDFPFRSPLFRIYNSNDELDARGSYGALYKCSWAISRNIPTYYFPETLNWGTASYLNEWNNPLVSLEISGPSTINANSSNKYIGLGTFSSGHTGVGCKVLWMITEGAEYASISADGVVATGAVDATQIVRIKATTTLGGVTRNATKTVTLKP